MHATSAVALAVVAINAASTLAIPTGPIGDGLEARSYFRRAPTKPVAEANHKDATVADPTKPGSHHEKSSGTATTVTVTVRPRPTACKAGETPSVRKKSTSKGKKSSTQHEEGTTGHANHPNGKHASPAQAVVARAVDASATPSSKATHSGTTPTPAPEHPKGSHHNKAAAGAVFSSNTHVGKDKATTVRHFVKATTTHCFAPTGSAHTKGAAHKDTTTGGTHANGAAHKDTTDSTHSSGAAGKAKAEPKVARRSVAAHQATPTDKTGTGKAHEKGSHEKSSGTATTVTVTVRPRPTACKAGETPSVRKKSTSKGNKSSTQHEEGTAGHANHPSGKHASPAQAVVARAVDASATPTSKATSSSGTTPTPAPEHHKGTHHDKAAAGAVFSSNTHVGKDKATTVRHFVKATTTHCYAPTGSAHAKGASHKSGDSHKAGDAHKTGESTTDHTAHKSATNQAALGGKPKAADSKLVARAVDILERYFSELDELD